VLALLLAELVDRVASLHSRFLNQTRWLRLGQFSLVVKGRSSIKREASRDGLAHVLGAWIVQIIGACIVERPVHRRILFKDWLASNENYVFFRRVGLGGLTSVQLRAINVCIWRHRELVCGQQRRFLMQVLNNRRVVFRRHREVGRPPLLLFFSSQPRQGFLDDGVLDIRSGEVRFNFGRSDLRDVSALVV